MRNYSDERYERAIEEMAEIPRYICDFVADGQDLDTLVLLFLSRGLPLRNRSSSDDHLIDRYDVQADKLRSAFEKFCHEKMTGHAVSRVDTYIRFIDQQHEEDAA